VNFDKSRHEPHHAHLARRAYRASELPRVLPFGKTKIAELLRTGAIKSRLVGGSRIITAEEVERLIAGGE
jgi:hypothetical protein